MGKNIEDTEESSLRDNIQKTIDDYFGSRGGFATGWYIIVDGMDGDGNRVWAYRYPEQQSVATNLGLIEFSKIAQEMATYNLMNVQDNDEDNDG